MSDLGDLTPMMKAYSDLGAALVKGMTDLMNRPEVQALVKLSENPDFMAALEASHGAPRRRPCHCLCGHAHPGRHVCDGNAVTAIPRIWRGDRIDVATCAPCAAELMSALPRRTSRWPRKR